MDRVNLLPMWTIIGEPCSHAKEVNGYPSGSVYLVRRIYPEDMVLRCKKAAWRLLYASDGMDAELSMEDYVVDYYGELKGHLVGDTVLWYDDFKRGGNHEHSYVSVGGELVRLGFSRW